MKEIEDILFEKNLKRLSPQELNAVRDAIKKKIEEIDSLVPKINCINQAKLIKKIIAINNEIKIRQNLKN